MSQRSDNANPPVGYLWVIDILIPDAITLLATTTCALPLPGQGRVIRSFYPERRPTHRSRFRAASTSRDLFPLRRRFRIRSARPFTNPDDSGPLLRAPEENEWGPRLFSKSRR